MIPTKTIEELITKHSTLEKDLSSGSLDNKVFAEKSKEYSDVNEIISNAKKYLSFENEKQELLRKLRETLPFSPEMQPEKSSIWSGTRTIYGSDRMPLCGELPQHRNIFVLTALGSKGWLWGPWTAQILQKQIQFKTKINGFEAVDLMRANAEDGWYSPFIM